MLDRSEPNIQAKETGFEKKDHGMWLYSISKVDL